MALSKKLLAGGLVALALMATTGAAMAASAYATGNVNVRSGPGTGYRVLDVMRRGEQVDVEQCRGSWCYIDRRGADGWVSASYLDRGYNGGGWDDDDHWDRPPVWNPRPPRPPRWNPRPPQQPWSNYPTYPRHPGSSVCFDGPDGYFCIGN